ncbi:hypothetical protein AWB64_02308 [Caballeronia sordidicola]|uniref:Uncharacterized protein n=1 Tax=Caballeronia sordidicola TaxID=196367 RepID=A0A158G7A3_CABSO|nr:hypothetical protein [Caballeronia sordidicola]SAL27753.1 hypothetical protein AWB64_02308 [Caballeronia sordidicola]
MNALPSISRPVVLPDASVWFSAYAFGWGYRAFSLPADVVCEQLGAADTTRHQLVLAFELGRKRIVRSVEKCSAADAGERVALRTLDL